MLLLSSNPSTLFTKVLFHNFHIQPIIFLPQLLIFSPVICLYLLNSLTFSLYLLYPPQNSYSFLRHQTHTRVHYHFFITINIMQIFKIFLLTLLNQESTFFLHLLYPLLNSFLFPFFQTDHLHCYFS